METIKRIAAAAALVGGLVLPATAAEPEFVDGIAAVVNSEVITRKELRDRVEMAVRQLSRQGTQLPPPDIIERQVMERLILEKAQLQMARESGMSVDDETLARALWDLAEESVAQPSPIGMIGPQMAICDITSGSLARSSGGAE